MNEKIQPKKELMDVDETDLKSRQKKVKQQI